MTLTEQHDIASIIAAVAIIVCVPIIVGAIAGVIDYHRKVK